MCYGGPTGCGSYNGPLDRDPIVVIYGRGREVYHTSRLFTVSSVPRFILTRRSSRGNFLCASVFGGFMSAGRYSRGG
jgi:hypothetical protein